MHLKRWLTSLVLIPVLVLLIFRGGPNLFFLFTVAVCLLSLREYYRIIPHGSRGALMDRISAAGYVLGTALVLCAHLLSPLWLVFMFSIALIVPGWICIRDFDPDAGIPAMLAYHALAMVYIPLSLSDFVLIRQADSGAHWILLILCVISAGDVGAFYVGRRWGREKLCPAVSPGKTVAGAVGGLGANLVAGLCVGGLLLPALPWWKGAPFYIAMGVAGQIGDLFESMLKRAAGMKDSGNLLPGHGGLLDRIDALLFAAPVALVMVIYVF